MAYAILKNRRVVKIIETDEISAQAEVSESNGDSYILVSGDCIVGQKYANGRFVDVSEADAEAERQDVKPLKLKQAENDFLELVATVPGVQPGDNSDALTAKIEADENLSNNEKTALGLKLLNAIHEVELAGGSWYDLPLTLHNIEY